MPPVSSMKRPNIEVAVSSLYGDLTVPSKVLHVIDELVRYIQYLERERNTIDPRNIDILSPPRKNDNTM